MSGFLRTCRRVKIFNGGQPARHNLRTFATKDLSRFAEGDRVLIDGVRLSPKLLKDESFNYQHGLINNNEIIGKSVLAPLYVRSVSGKAYKIELPSLEEYVTGTPRLVTPVYSSYATSIVSLLDINPKSFTEHANELHTTRPKLEILEAGSGHGSLTLHIARAIAAANPPPPPTEVPGVSPHTRRIEAENLAQHEAWNAWKLSRVAILHTVENVIDNRRHAEKIVSGFRQGLYWPHVDFYHDTVSKWVEKKHKERGEAFLNHVILDMPAVQEQLHVMHTAMLEGGKLIVFVPSITQIVECVKEIHKRQLPFTLDRVLELGEGISNGRRWDVRLVAPRLPPKPKMKGLMPFVKALDKQRPTDAVEETERDDGDGEEEEVVATTTTTSMQQDEVMICRPQVGEKTFGGGFVAVFRKTSPEAMEIEKQWRRLQSSQSRRRFRS